MNVIPRHKPVIGLLGPPGSGKSTVARHFASLGWAVIDADRLAKEALDEPVVRDRLVEWWGRGMLDPAGRVNRAAVARTVFNDDAALRRLEKLTHPRVVARRAELRRRYQEDPAVKGIVEDSPLLLEKRLDAQCDFLVYVEADRETRLERVRRSRGWSPHNLAEREKKQMALDIKRARAHYVVDNRDDEPETLKQVHRVHSSISTKQLKQLDR